MDRYLFTFFIALLAVKSLAQEPIMHHYTTEDGIPGTEVFDIIQDKKGYIWIATNNGISKFNGKEFKNFQTKDGLPDNSVIEFIKDQDGKIWLLTFNNELSNISNDSIISYKYNNKLKEHEYSKSYCITSAYINANELVIGILGKGIYKIDSNGNIDTIKCCGESSSFAYKYTENDIIFSSIRPFEQNYKTHFYSDGKEYIINPFNKKITGSVKYEFDIFENQIAYSIGNHLFILKNFKIVNHISHFSLITKLRYDQKGQLWVCTYNNGIFSYKCPEKNKIPENNFLKNKTITSVYFAKTGSIWMSTLKNGLYHIPNLEIKQFYTSFDSEIGEINKLTTDNERIWFSTLKNDIGYIEDRLNVKYELSKYNSYNISSLHFDTLSNNIWGAFQGGSMSIFHFDINECNVLKNKRKGKKGLHFWNISSLESSNNCLVLGTSNFLTVKEKNLNNIFEKRFSAQTICIGNSTDEIWIGNRDGLYLKQADTIIPFQHSIKLFTKRIVDIEYYKPENLLFAATKDTGVYILHGDKTISITTKNGLSGNNVTSLYVKNGILWVATTNGLDKITTKTTFFESFEIENFNKNNGLVSNIINDIEVLDSIVYVAGNKGITYFNHYNTKKNLNPPPIYLRNIKINNKDTVIKDLYKLNYNENNILIAVEGLNYYSPDAVIYKYKLEKLHKDWQTSKSDLIEFSLLPPGNYKCIIYAVSENNVWSTTPVKINLIIDSPFYQTWWFISLIVLLIISVTTFIIQRFNRIKLKEHKKRSILEKTLVKERQKALSQQMNPHFIFNALSSIQNYIYKGDRIASSVYLEKFSVLIRNMLYNSQSDSILLKDEIASLKTYIDLERLRLDNKFEYLIHMNESTEIEETRIPAFLIQPYIENSIWHGLHHIEKNGLLEITFEEKNKQINCTIIDNGIGREASKQLNSKRRKSHTSLGTKITNNRLELINELYQGSFNVIYTDLYNENENVCGTKVELSIPKIGI